MQQEQYGGRMSRRERTGEENVCSGEDACKKDVKDGGGGGGVDKCACDNDKGKGR